MRRKEKIVDPDHEYATCPNCGRLVIVRFDDKIANHNIGWKPPVDGVSYPIRCPGSLKPVVRASV